MQMADYIISTEFAVKHYYDSINYYEEMVLKTVQELAVAKAELHIAGNQLSLGDWDPDDNLPFGFIDHYHALRAKNAADVERLQPILDRLVVQRDSVSQLCGSILQVAKQGLSMVYSNPSRWPVNVKCGSQPISQIVRMTRNQSMHFEEGRHDSYRECFRVMGEEFGISFDLNRNMAREVIFKVLGWKDAETFKIGMLNL